MKENLLGLDIKHLNWIWEWVKYEKYKKTYERIYLKFECVNVLQLKFESSMDSSRLFLWLDGNLAFILHR